MSNVITTKLESVRQIRFEGNKKITRTLVSKSKPNDGVVYIKDKVRGVPKGYNLVSNRVEEAIPDYTTTGYFDLSRTVVTNRYNLPEVTGVKVEKPKPTKQIASLWEDQQYSCNYTEGSNALFTLLLKFKFANYEPYKESAIPYLGMLKIEDLHECKVEPKPNSPIEKVCISGTNTTKDLQGFDVEEEFLATLWFENGKPIGWYYFDERFSDVAQTKLDRAVENYFRINEIR